MSYNENEKLIIELRNRVAVLEKELARANGLEEKLEQIQKSVENAARQARIDSIGTPIDYYGSHRDTSLFIPGIF